MAKSQDEQLEKQDRQQWTAGIGRQVISALGQPSGFQRIQVRWLWDRYYRANVYVGEDNANARVINSFFLEADGDGNIATSNPSITRQY